MHTFKVDNVHTASYRPDGKRILSISLGGIVKEWDRESSQCLRTPKGYTGEVKSALYSSNELRVLTASHGYTVEE